MLDPQALPKGGFEMINYFNQIKDKRGQLDLQRLKIINNPLFLYHKVRKFTTGTNYSGMDKVKCLKDSF